MSGIRILPAGDRALLVELPDRVTPSGLAERLRARPIEGVADVLPAAGTVLITLAARATSATIADRVNS
ncbi:carboxyltransferase domain-containing protein, partial [Nocardia gipuzkoensis]